MTAKRIAAILGIILLLGMYVATLLVAIFDRASSGKWFMACLIATVTVPLLLWIYIWMYGVLTQKHTIASFDVRKPESQAAPEDFADVSEEDIAEDAEGAMPEDGQEETEEDSDNA